jgi:hypothetical protein
LKEGFVSPSFFGFDFQKFIGSKTLCEAKISKHSRRISRQVLRREKAGPTSSEQDLYLLSAAKCVNLNRYLFMLSEIMNYREIGRSSASGDN